MIFAVQDGWPATQMNTIDYIGIYVTHMDRRQNKTKHKTKTTTPQKASPPPPPLKTHKTTIKMKKRIKCIKQEKTYKYFFLGNQPTTHPILGRPCIWLRLRGPPRFLASAEGMMGTGFTGVALNTVAKVTTSNCTWAMVFSACSGERKLHHPFTSSMLLSSKVPRLQQRFCSIWYEHW